MLEFRQTTLPSDAILMVWQGTIVEKEEKEDAAKALTEILHLKNVPCILGCVETLPTPGENDTGGRIDLVFAIQSSDAPTAAVHRLRTVDIKWFEDAQKDLYPPLI